MCPEDVVAQEVIILSFSRISLRSPHINCKWFPQIVVQKDSARGVHFRRAGPREKVN